MRVIVIDTETTGLSSSDEVLELAIVNADGRKLFHERFKPQNKESWPRAQRIHGISPDDVRDKDSIARHKELLERRYFNGKCLLVGFNLFSFDIPKLESCGINVRYAATYDVMEEYRDRFHLDSGYKLEDCAREFGYMSFKAHSALADAKATAYVYRKLEQGELPKFERERRQREDEEITRSRFGRLKATLCFLVTLALVIGAIYMATASQMISCGILAAVSLLFLFVGIRFW